MLYLKNQLKTLKKKKPLKKIRRKALKNKPQCKGFCVKVFIKKPKKPNSALRSVAKVFTSTEFYVDIHIPGEKHNLQKHSTILIRGCRVRDLPGVNYRAIRGVYDLKGVLERMQGRSKYGTIKTI